MAKCALNRVQLTRASLTVVSSNLRSECFDWISVRVLSKFYVASMCE